MRTNSVGLFHRVATVWASLYSCRDVQIIPLYYYTVSRPMQLGRLLFWLLALLSGLSGPLSRGTGPDVCYNSVFRLFAFRIRIEYLIMFQQKLCPRRCFVSSLLGCSLGLAQSLCSLDFICFIVVKSRQACYRRRVPNTTPYKILSEVAFSAY